MIFYEIALVFGLKVYLFIMILGLFFGVEGII